MQRMRDKPSSGHLLSRGEAEEPGLASAAKPVAIRAAKAARRPPKRTGRALSRADVTDVFRRFQAANPEPRGELTSINTFTLLVAVVLSAQATDVSVNKATSPLFALADTPQKMLDLGEERIRAFIRTIGLYKAKAKNVVALSRRLIDVFDGQVPDNRADLESLPGVGRKTANVLLNSAYGVAVIAIDTHLFRVSNRMPLAKGKTPLDVELGLERVIPETFKLHAHHWLILHGRYVCKARKPICGSCLVADFCRWPDKDLSQQA